MDVDQGETITYCGINSMDTTRDTPADGAQLVRGNKALFKHIEKNRSPTGVDGMNHGLALVCPVWATQLGSVGALKPSENPPAGCSNSCNTDSSRAGHHHALPLRRPVLACSTIRVTKMGASNLFEEEWVVQLPAEIFGQRYAIKRHLVNPPRGDAGRRYRFFRRAVADKTLTRAGKDVANMKDIMVNCALTTDDDTMSCIRPNHWKHASIAHLTQQAYRGPLTARGHFESTTSEPSLAAMEDATNPPSVPQGYCLGVFGVLQTATYPIILLGSLLQGNSSALPPTTSAGGRRFAALDAAFDRLAASLLE
ncbi:hypothetical protein SGCOL_007627 [Colletotrichum sp. CLE4]